MSAEPAQPAPRPIPRPRPRAAPCPYCGAISEAAGLGGGRNPALAAATGSPPGSDRCPSCRGLLDPLSRQASQNSMGPWFIRDEANPFRPGCSIDTLRRLAARSKIGPNTIVRGPTTRQFWMFARNTPGVANLLGECHSCHGRASAGDEACSACGASFVVPDDRQHLGLGPVHLLPGHAAPETIAAASAPPANGAALLLLAVGITATLLGMIATGGVVAAGWLAMRQPAPAEAGVGNWVEPESGGAAVAVAVASERPADSEIAPGETGSIHEASFTERWREQQRLSERL